MYKQAFQTYKDIFPIILMIAISLPIVTLFIKSTGISIALTAIIAFYAHRNVLTGEKLGFKSGFKKSPDKTATFSWGFGWRFAVLLLLPLILAIIPSIFTIGSYEDSVFLMTFLFVFIVFLGIALSLFGTVLPAASLRADASFSAALKRGKPRFWGTLWKLVTGPVVVSAISMVVLVTLYSLIPETALESPGFTLADIAIGFVSGLISAFATVLVATILSQVYMDSVPGTFPKSDNLGH